MDCKNCKIPLLYDDEMLVCVKCGLFVFPFVNSYDNENMVFTSNNFVKYSRIIHFKQTIHQIIGMEQYEYHAKYLMKFKMNLTLKIQLRKILL